MYCTFTYACEMLLEKREKRYTTTEEKLIEEKGHWTDAREVAESNIGM